MALSTEDRQAMILDLLDPDDEAGLAGKIDRYWAKPSFEAAALQSEDLRDLLVTEAMLPLALRFYATDVDYTQQNASEKRSQIFANLQKLFADLPAQIAAERARVNAGGFAPRVGALPKQAPIEVPTGYLPNPNAGWLRGDPLGRNRP